MRRSRDLRIVVLGILASAALLVAGVCGLVALDVGSAPSGGSVAASPMSGMSMGVGGEDEAVLCDGMCVMGSGQACGPVVALGAVSVLGLLLGARRHTFLGLDARTGRGTRGSGTADDLGIARAWGRLELCVIRV